MTMPNEQLTMDTACVADIALAFPQSIDVLDQYRLDYCCGGKKSFLSACEKAGVNPGAVWQEIVTRRIEDANAEAFDFDGWSPSLLIEFVIQHHHKYVKESVDQIKALLEKVCNAHGDESPYLLDVKQQFTSLAYDLLNHMRKEEEILFPAIQQMLGINLSELESALTLKQLQAPILIMEDEHEVAGDIIKSIRSLTNDYTTPDYACPTFKVTYAMLAHFDRDLMRHVHLENNVLFPKALKLAVSVL